MGRKNIGLNDRYYIFVGVDDQDVHHFIGGFTSSSPIIAYLKTFLFRHRFKYRDRFKRIYSKRTF